MRSGACVLQPTGPWIPHPTHVALAEELNSVLLTADDRLDRSLGIRCVAGVARI